MRLMEMIKLKPLTVAQGSWGGNFRWDSAKLHREGAIEAQTIYDTEARAHRRGEFAGVRAARRARDSRRLLHANTLSGTYQRPMPTTIRHIPADTSLVQDFRGRHKPQLSATGANALRSGIITDSRLAAGARYKKTTPKLARKLVAARIGAGRLKMSTDVVWGNLLESPRWARNFEQLSKAAQKKLMRRMPAGTSRQVSTGRARVLGDGAEKVVYKSVTGGKGESATAVVRSRPLTGHFIDTPKHRALDGTSPKQRFHLMKQLERKGIGVRMYDQHPRGYTMERMRPVNAAHAQSVRKLAAKIRRKASAYQGLDNSHPDYPHARVNFSSGPRVLADMSHANIMVDRKGRAKLTDPLFFRPKDLNRVSEAEYLPGGRAEGRSASEFPKDQLRIGRKVEMEHTNNPRIATEIAKDHLAEIKDYYTRLRRMERQAKRGRRR